MYKKYLLIGCLWGLVSCREAPPQGILSKEKMRAVLVDLKLAKYALPYRDTQREKPVQPEAWYAYVFQKNGITPRDFEKSNRYYTEHPQLYIDIMRAVVDSLTKLKNRVDQRVKTHKNTLKIEPPPTQRHRNQSSQPNRSNSLTPANPPTHPN